MLQHDLRTELVRPLDMPSKVYVWCICGTMLDIQTQINDRKMTLDTFATHLRDTITVRLTAISQTGDEAFYCP